MALISVAVLFHMFVVAILLAACLWMLVFMYPDLPRIFILVREWLEEWVENRRRVQAAPVDPLPDVVVVRPRPMDPIHRRLLLHQSLDQYERRVENARNIFTDYRHRAEKNEFLVSKIYEKSENFSKIWPICPI